MSDKPRIESVEHSGLYYIFPLDDKDYASKIQLGDAGSFYDKLRNVYWLYDLSGAHEGEPIRVKVKNPREEADDYGGFDPEFDSIRWADNDGELEAIIRDTYFDAIRDSIRENYDAMD